MKTLVAAIAAGLLGGGAAIGVVAAGLVPVPQSTATNRTPVATESEADTNDTNARDYEAEIAALRKEIDSLRVVRPASGMSESDVRKLVNSEVEHFKSTLAPTKPVAEPTDGPRPAEGGTFDTTVRNLVREETAKMRAEEAETRRLERQAQRVAQLEETKENITENVPAFLKNQATRLKLDEAQITSITPVLVTYLQSRADLQSERQSARIDGKEKEYDNTAHDEKIKQLEATAHSALGGIVAQETAESLMRSSLRLGTNFPSRGEADTPAPARPNQQQPGQRGRRGGNGGND